MIQFLHKQHRNYKVSHLFKVITVNLIKSKELYLLYHYNISSNFWHVFFFPQIELPKRIESIFHTFDSERSFCHVVKNICQVAYIRKCIRYYVWNDDNNIDQISKRKWQKMYQTCADQVIANGWNILMIGCLKNTHRIMGSLGYLYDRQLCFHLS